MALLTVTNVSDNLIESFGAPSLAKLAGPGLAFILAARWALRRERPFVDVQAMALFGLYGLVMGLSALHAQDWTISLDLATRYLTRDLVIVFLALAFFREPRALAVYVWTAILALAAICLLCFWQYATGDFSDDFYGFARILYVSRRLSGPINDPNFFAAMLVFFIPLLLREVLMGEGWRRRIVERGALRGAAHRDAADRVARARCWRSGSALVLPSRSSSTAARSSRRWRIGAVLMVAVGTFPVG